MPRLPNASAHRAIRPSFIVRSAARGEPRAQYVLGTAHFNGDLATRDWPRAYALTKRASDAGLSIASARLVQLDNLIPLDQRQRGLAMIPDMEDLKASMDHNTRVTAELAIAMTRMWELEAIQTLGAGNAGALPADTQDIDGDTNVTEALPLAA